MLELFVDWSSCMSASEEYFAKCRATENVQTTDRSVCAEAGTLQSDWQQLLQTIPTREVTQEFR